MAQNTGVTDELTENGIVSDDPDITRAEYVDLHGEPVFENDEVVIYADRHGHELNEWADALEMDRSSLSARMHEIARRYHTYGDVPSGAGDPWAVVDPIVFDAQSFD